MNYANPVVNIPNYLQSSFICIPWAHNIYMLPKAGKLSVHICGVVLLEFVKDMFGQQHRSSSYSGMPVVPVIDFIMVGNGGSG